MQAETNNSSDRETGGTLLSGYGLLQANNDVQTNANAKKSEEIALRSDKHRAISVLSRKFSEEQVRLWRDCMSSHQVGLSIREVTELPDKVLFSVWFSGNTEGVVGRVTVENGTLDKPPNFTIHHAQALTFTATRIDPKTPTIITAESTSSPSQGRCVVAGVVFEKRVGSGKFNERFRFEVPKAGNYRVAAANSFHPKRGRDGYASVSLFINDLETPVSSKEEKSKGQSKTAYCEVVRWFDKGISLTIYATGKVENQTNFNQVVEVWSLDP